MATRYRETDHRSPISYTVYDTPGGLQSGYSRTTYAGEAKIMQDTVTPGFAKRIRKGELICNPVYVAYSLETDGSSTVVVGPHGDWGTRTFSGDIAAVCGAHNQGSLNPTPDDVPNMKANTLIEAYAKVDASAVMGMTNIVEFGQTVGMLRRPLGSALKLVQKMIKRKESLTRKGWHGTLAMANAWLEYRYGWKPLMIDCGNIIEKVQDEKNVWASSNKRGNRFVARAGIRGSKKVFESQVVTGAPGGLQVTFTGRLETQTDVNSGVIYRVIDENYHRSWQSALGLRLQDVPAAVWEVIPLSFVVDWFVGVGSWIQAVTPKPNIQFLSNWTTVVVNEFHSGSGVKTRMTIGQVGATPAHTYEGTAADSSNTTYSYIRETNLSLPSTPVVRNNFSSIRQVDACALSITKLLAGFDKFKR